jgi:hydroxymethylpyrimidine pyrophosphatase-like HAD family hydrolase
MKNHSVLAFDYDGTLATEGTVAPPTITALKALLSSDRRLVLASGRQLSELVNIFPALALFAWVIAENGAVIYETATGLSEVMGAPPPAEFLRAVDERGIRPVATGQVIVATKSGYRKTLLGLIESMDLSHQVILNKDAAMVLPEGVNKGSSLLWVLQRMGLNKGVVIGVGDGENDADLFRASGFRVAVANAVPELKEMADWVTPDAAGSGIEQLSELLLSD